MADIAELGVGVDTSGLKSGQRELLNFQKAAIRAAGGVDDLSKVQSRLFRNDKGQFVSQAVAIKQYEAEVTSLAQKYGVLESASESYNSAQNKLASSLSVGASSLQRTDAQLESVASQYITTANAASTLSRAQNSTAGAAGNVFAQFNDIGVMLASGQNPFVLALQQGTQLNQVWASMGNSARGIGSAIGGAFRAMLNPVSLLTIGLIAGAGALVQWLTSGKQAKTTIDDINSSIQSLQTAVDEIRAIPSLLTAEGIAQITTQYGMLNIQVASHVTELQRLNVEALRFKNIDMFADLRSQFAGGIFSTELRNMASALGLNVGQANQLSAAFDRLGDASGPDEQIKAINRLLEVLSLATRDQKELTKEQFQFRTSLLEARDAVMQQKAALDQYNGSIGTANQLTVAYAGTLGILATAARTAAVAQQQLNQQVAFGNDLDPLNGFSRSSSDAIQLGLGGTLATPDVFVPLDDRSASGGGGSSGGGGGASAADQIQEDFKNRWQALQEGFKGEFDLSLVEYQKQLETLDWALSQKLIKEQEFQRNKQLLYTMTFGTEAEQTLLQYQLDQTALQTALDQKLITHQTYLQRLQAMQFEYQSQAHMTDQNMLAANLGRTSQYFGQLVSLTGNSYDTLAKLQQSFAAGQALVNAYLAASQTLADPTLGFWGKMAAYGKVLAAGLGLVSAIKGAGGGSSGGGGGDAGGQAATAAQQQPNREVLVRLEGDEFLVGLASSVMEQIYDQTKDGRVVVARDF